MAYAPPDPLIGTVLAGRFQIIGLIGTGGMGRVYRAVQKPLDREVALKVLNPRFDGTKDPNFEDRFFLEALMTARLRHPNTVTLHDYGRAEDGIYYMALELLDGRTLQQVLVNDGPMAWPRVFSIGAQVARSLREAHQLGLVHRDLKPANIMLLPEVPEGYRVKLLDFGLVKSFLSLPEAARKETPGELTEAGVVLGSPLYMAPEQAQRSADLRSDIYSLGAVLYSAIAGRTPFLGKKPLELLLKHMHEAPTPLSSLVELPAEVDAVVMKCLEKRPGDRFQSMDELLVAMHQAVCRHGHGGLYVTTDGVVTAPGREVTPTPAPPAALAAPNAPVSPAAPPLLVPPRLLPRVNPSGPSSSPSNPSNPSPPLRAQGTSRPAAVPELPGRSRRSRMNWRRLGFMLLGLGVGSSALGAVLARRGTPLARPSPTEVSFEVTSEPSGAAVLERGHVVGVTPFSVDRPRRGDGLARLELALVLDGYETAVVLAQGSEGLVSVHEALIRRHPARSSIRLPPTALTFTPPRVPAPAGVAAPLAHPVKPPPRAPLIAPKPPASPTQPTPASPYRSNPYD